MRIELRGNLVVDSGGVNASTGVVNGSGLYSEWESMSKLMAAVAMLLLLCLRCGAEQVMFDCRLLLLADGGVIIWI